MLYVRPVHDPCLEASRLSEFLGKDCVVITSNFRCPLERCSENAGPFRGSRCWCRVDLAARELSALGFPQVAAAFHCDYTADGAISFGEALLALTSELRSLALFSNTDGRPRWTWPRTWRASLHAGAWRRHSTFDEATACIDDAANYLIKVGQVGSGVTTTWFE